jgi:HlyD family secretion protein
MPLDGLPVGARTRLLVASMSSVDTAPTRPTPRPLSDTPTSGVATSTWAGPGVGVPAAAAAATPSATHGRRRWWWIGAGVLVVGIVAARAFSGDAAPQYLSSKVQHGDIRDAVDATGTVNAVVTVQVGSQVSGTIAKLNADFNTRVHKGDVIALIEPSLLEGTLQQATADLDDARAAVSVANANLAKARAALVQLKAEFDRTTALQGSKAVTQAEVDVARANYESARAAVDAAQAGITQALAQVKQKEAAVAIARTNLDHAVIRSPIDGVVVARNVDVGQTVAASLQAPTIFTIAQDLTHMWVYAKVDESDVGRITPGQPVTFKVDAFPKDQFHGTVAQVRMNPTTIQNVVTYDAIIDFQNPELKLFPGMTAYVTIPVATATNVVKLPNAALRYAPPLSGDAVRAALAKQGIDPSATLPAEERSAAGAHAVVWKLGAGGALTPVEVSLGITDHAYTEVRGVAHGTLAPGDDVVTTTVDTKHATATPAGPGTPGAAGARR